MANSYAVSYVLHKAFWELLQEGYLKPPPKVSPGRWQKTFAGYAHLAPKERLYEAFQEDLFTTYVSCAPTRSSQYEGEDLMVEIMLSEARRRAGAKVGTLSYTRSDFYSREVLYELVRVVDSACGAKAGKILRNRLKEAKIKYSKKQVLTEAQKEERLRRLVDGPYEALRREALERNTHG